MTDFAPQAVKHPPCSACVEPKNEGPFAVHFNVIGVGSWNWHLCHMHQRAAVHAVLSVVTPAQIAPDDPEQGNTVVGAAEEPELPCAPTCSVCGRVLTTGRIGACPGTCMRKMALGTTTP